MTKYICIYPCCVAQDIHWNSIGLHLSINRLLCAYIKYHRGALCVYIEYYCACVLEGFTQGGRLQLADAAPWGNFWFALSARNYASLVLLWVKKFSKLTEGVCVVKSELNNHRWFPGLLQSTLRRKKWNSGKFSFVGEHFDRNLTIWQNVTPVSSVFCDPPVPCVYQQWGRDLHLEFGTLIRFSQ